MQLLEVNGRAAVKILAKKLADPKNSKAILFDCEGDKHWIPKSVHKIIDKETIMVQQWFYKQNLS